MLPFSGVSRNIVYGTSCQSECRYDGARGFWTLFLPIELPHFKNFERLSLGPLLLPYLSFEQ